METLLNQTHQLLILVQWWKRLGMKKLTKNVNKSRDLVAWSRNWWQDKEGGTNKIHNIGWTCLKKVLLFNEHSFCDFFLIIYIMIIWLYGFIITYKYDIAIVFRRIVRQILTKSFKIFQKNLMKWLIEICTNWKRTLELYNILYKSREAHFFSATTQASEEAAFMGVLQKICLLKNTETYIRTSRWKNCFSTNSLRSSIKIFLLHESFSLNSWRSWIAFLKSSSDRIPRKSTDNPLFCWDVKNGLWNSR